MDPVSILGLASLALATSRDEDNPPAKNLKFGWYRIDAMLVFHDPVIQTIADQNWANPLPDVRKKLGKRADELLSNPDLRLVYQVVDDLYAAMQHGHIYQTGWQGNVLYAFDVCTHVDHTHEYPCSKISLTIQLDPYLHNRIRWNVETILEQLIGILSFDTTSDSQFSNFLLPKLKPIQISRIRANESLEEPVPATTWDAWNEGDMLTSLGLPIEDEDQKIDYYAIDCWNRCKDDSEVVRPLDVPDRKIENANLRISDEQNRITFEHISYQPRIGAEETIFGTVHIQGTGHHGMLHRMTIDDGGMQRTVRDNWARMDDAYNLDPDGYFETIKLDDVTLTFENGVMWKHITIPGDWILILYPFVS